MACPSTYPIKKKGTYEDNGVHAAVYNPEDASTDTMFPLRADNGRYHIDVEEKFGEQNFRVFSEMRGKILHYNPIFF